MSRFLAVLLTAIAALALAEVAVAAEHSQVINGGRTLVVGDSHTWLAGLGQQYPRWDVDAQVGRDSSAGLAVAESLLRHRHRRVVFDLATNDWPSPRAFQRNLRAVRRLIDGRRLTLVTSRTITGIPEMDRGVAAVNKRITKFARRHDRVGVIRFHRVLRERPELFDADRVHLTHEGYRVRTQAVRSGAA